VTESKDSTVELVVSPEAKGSRLDVFCASRIDALSRNQIQKLNQDGRIEVDGVQRPDHYALRGGEVVRLRIPEPVPRTAPSPQDIPLRIAYEDDHLVVVNKDAGLVVHPAHGSPDGTVVNALLGRGSELSALGGAERPGVVHRLDKGTSGLLIVAKTDEAFRGLTAQIKARRLEKTYHTIVWGNLGVSSRTIDAPIARHPVHRQSMSVAKSGGREAITEVFVVDSFDYFDYLRVATVTGRTHQIRVHMEHISHPIVGDPVYGGHRKGLPSNARSRRRLSALLNVMQRPALHASRLSFEHPVTGERLRFKTALPADMTLAIELLHRADWM
jgi:23S rRNA pseudouridine1911/1915/1917 synthase